MDLLLTFDIGTTSVKTCVFDHSLTMRSSAITEYKVETPSSQIVELSPHVYWDSIKKGIDQAFNSKEISITDVRAVSVSTQGETLIPVDQSGKALYNAVVWLDGRAEKEADTIKSKIPADVFYQHTGIPMCNGLCPISKLLWFKQERPDIYEKTYKFLLLEDYIIFRLTGKFVTEKSLLCTTGYFDIIADRIWDEIFDSTGLDRQKIPEPLECGTIVGNITLQAANDTGLPMRAAVITSAMDQTAAAIGAGNISPGIISETTGTAMCIAATSSQPDMNNSSRITVYRHAWHNGYLLMPVSMTAGMTLKWFKDSFCQEEIHEAERTGNSVYMLIDKLVETVSPGSGGLLLIPYLSGVIQPDNVPNARGVFYGIGLNTGKPEFLRAIFEGIAYMLRENLELICDINHKEINTIRSLGGGAKSEIWRQIKSDVCNIQIESMENEECTSIGTAILSSVALHYYPSLSKAVKKGNRVISTNIPSERSRSIYDSGYKCYKDIWSRLKTSYIKE